MESYISSEIGTRVEADWKPCDRVYLCSKKHSILYLHYLDARMRLHPPLQKNFYAGPRRGGENAGFHCKPWDMAKELFDPRKREERPFAGV